MTKRVAVIGGGFGGLSAAGELARLGHAVTLFEGSDTLGGKAQVVEHGGLKLDTGPTLLTMPETVRATFERLGASPPRFHRLELHSAYRWPDGSAFACWDDLERTLHEAAQFDERDALRRFTAKAESIYRAAGEPYLEAPYETFPSFLGRALRRGLGTMATGLGLSTLDSLAGSFFRSPQLRQFVGRFATYTGGSPFESSAAFAMIPHIERAFGVHHVEGGMRALVQSLERAVRALGVDIKLGAKASLVADRTELVAGVHGDERAFDAVVFNQDPLTLRAEPRGPLAMSGFVFFVRAHRRLTLPHHLILFSSDSKKEFQQLFSGVIPEEPTVYVCHPAATDGTMAPEQESGLFVMINAPAFSNHERAAQLWSEAGPRLEAWCLERLRQHFPDLGPLEVFDRRTPVDLAERGAPGGSIYGFLPHGRFGPFRRPALRGSRPGTFFAGGGTHPGGGVPLVMLSGHFAAQLAQRHLLSGTGRQRA